MGRVSSFSRCIVVISLGICGFILASISLMIASKDVLASPSGDDRIVFYESFDEAEVRRTLPGGWEFEGEIVSDAYQGSGSLLIEDDSSTLYRRARSPLIEIESDTDYEISIWTKSDTMLDDYTSLQLVVFAFDADGDSLPTRWNVLDRSFDWTHNVFDYTSHANVGTIQIMLYPAAGDRSYVGRAWFDELKIMQK